jgi:copper homeostasis protein
MQKLVERILEICCDTLESALIAEKSGANRIELCEDLLAGGVTPSAAKIKLLKKYLQIPVAVLIRPRPGDFIYNQWEKETIIENIKIAKQLGADAIVGGALNEDLSIDSDFTKVMIEAASPLPFVFHKAFDICENDLEALSLLVDLGVSRLLTSGQRNTALEGKDKIAQYVEQFGQKITIMAGGGIRPNNLSALKTVQGLHQVHSAAKIWNQSTFQESEKWLKVDAKQIKQMRAILDKD